MVPTKPGTKAGIKAGHRVPELRFGCGMCSACTLPMALPAAERSSGHGSKPKVEVATTLPPRKRASSPRCASFCASSRASTPLRRASQHALLMHPTPAFGGPRASALPRPLICCFLHVPLCSPQRAILLLASVPSVPSQVCFKMGLQRDAVSLCALVPECVSSFVGLFVVSAQWRAKSVQIRSVCASPV